jgi:hypothetical protein
MGMNWLTLAEIIADYFLRGVAGCPSPNVAKASYRYNRVKFLPVISVSAWMA